RSLHDALPIAANGKGRPRRGDGPFNALDPLRSASLLVRTMRTAPGTALLDFQAIRIVATVLPRDVVTFLALLARHGDLRSYVGRLRSHGKASLTYSLVASGVTVAGAGLEPATTRL